MNINATKVVSSCLILPDLRYLVDVTVKGLLEFTYCTRFILMDFVESRLNWCVLFIFLWLI